MTTPALAPLVHGQIEGLPEQYMVGNLAESWELSGNPVSVTWHLKHGIMWTGNANIGMAPRELTADDVAFSANRPLTISQMAAYFNWIKDIHATDRYTVVENLTAFNVIWAVDLGCAGFFGLVMCPESDKAGMADWKNAVGTGPFIISDYVSGSDVTYDSNPQYWGKTTINGKDYKLPFIKTLVYNIIPDEAMQIAALRTGKIDWWPKVPTTYADSLKQSSPDLVQDKYLSGTVQIFKLNRIDSPYLSNIKVRQALMIATNFQGIADSVYHGGDILGFPIGRGNPAYTAIADLPASTKALFDYNPTVASQMLADAGYSSGFSMTLTIGSDPTMLDLATAVAGMWTQVGIKTTIKTLDQTALTSVVNARSYDGAAIWTQSVNNPIGDLGLSRSDVLGAIYAKGEPFDAMYTAINQESDPVARTNEEKQLAIAMINDAGIIPFTNPYTLNCYWPWMKNYYGEIDTGYHNQIPMISRIWIDQKIKTAKSP